MSQHMHPSAPYQAAEFVKALARARARTGLTQAALGARLGLPQSHISKIERGRTDLRLSSLIELARQLDLDVVLVPRKYLPAVRSMIAAPPDDLESPRPDDDSRYLYRLRKP